MRVERARSIARNQVPRHDAAVDIDLAAVAGERCRRDRRHGTRQLLAYRATLHRRGRLPDLRAESNWEGKGEDHLDLLLVSQVRVIDGRAQPAAERVGAGVWRRAAGPCAAA